MRVPANGRVRPSAAEWRSVFEKCEASGLSALAFCQREGIPRSTFTRWQQRLRVAPSPPDVGLPLLVTGEDASLSSAALELSLPGGVVLPMIPARSLQAHFTLESRRPFRLIY